MVGDGDASARSAASRAPLRGAARRAERRAFDWPELDERAAAAMCYTSGTTGNPKGVVYCHRSTFLHSMRRARADALRARATTDRVLPIVPMFHANAWGLPYACVMAGADLVMPGRFLQAEPLARLIEEERPTLAGAVPTIWTRPARATPTSTSVDLSSLRMVIVRRLGRARAR